MARVMVWLLWLLLLLLTSAAAHHLMLLEHSNCLCLLLRSLRIVRQVRRVLHR